MKKNVLLLLALFPLFAAAQVGVNTADPAATLDVVAKNATGTTTNVDGLTVPKVDRERAQSMAGTPVSTLIYVDNVSTGSTIGSTVNVDKVGFYYFDGSVWVKFSNTSIDSANIYNTNGILTGNRIVSQEGNTLAFTGSAENAFSVDGNTFSVDAANNRIGIGIINPTEKLDILGNTRIRELQNGQNFDDFSRLVVAKTDGTLGYAQNSNVSFQSFQLRIPPHNSTVVDFTNHANTAYDADNWWVISKSSVAPGTNIPARMTIVYEYQGGAFPDPAQIFPQLTAGNNSSYPDVFAPAFINLATVGGKTRLTVSVARADHSGLQWGGTFLLNVLLGVKGAISAPPAPGTISTLNCAGATHNGTLTANSSASGVSSVISYTGGNGGFYNSQSISSTGVTGLTATLSGGNFATGSGNLTYTITGTPSAAGTASFAITIGGRSCTITRTVGAPVAGAIASLNCAGATHNGTLSAGVAASGVNSVISYTGGNGGTHAAQSVTSTGVTGLTATVSAGSFANGNGTLTYTITGTPSGSGTASFAINIGGKTCTITRTVTASVLPACTAEGYYANPNDPHQYYRCVQQSTQFIRYQYTCPNGNIYVAAPNGAQGKCVAP